MSKLTPEQNALISKLLVDLVLESGVIAQGNDLFKDAIASTRRVLVDNFCALNSETAPFSLAVWKASR